MFNSLITDYYYTYIYYISCFHLLNPYKKDKRTKGQKDIFPAYL